MAIPKVRTLRGSIFGNGNLKRTLILDDGLINQGYIVDELYVWKGELSDGNCKATLSTLPKVAGNPQDASQNTEIAWVSFVQEMNVTTVRSSVMQDRIVDPNHIINRDLYLSLITNSADATWNYMITMTKRILTDDEAIITIIKENAQS